MLGCPRTFFSQHAPLQGRPQRPFRKCCTCPLRRNCHARVGGFTAAYVVACVGARGGRGGGAGGGVGGGVASAPRVLQPPCTVPHKMGQFPGPSPSQWRWKFLAPHRPKQCPRGPLSGSRHFLGIYLRHNKTPHDAKGKVRGTGLQRGPQANTLHWFSFDNSVTVTTQCHSGHLQTCLRGGLLGRCAQARGCPLLGP